MSDGGTTGGLPPGWAWARLGDLAANEPNAMTDGPFGSKLKSEHYREEGIRVVRLGNIGLGRFIDQDKAFVDRSRAEELQKHRCFEGDLLIAALAEPVGRCAMVPTGLGDAIVKADCIRMNVHGELDPRYVALALNSPAGLARTALSSHGIGRLRINLGELKGVRIPTAPAEEQRRIVAKLDELLSRSRAAREALDAVPAMLEQYRKSVLAAAFRGELTAEWRAERRQTPLSECPNGRERPPRPARYDTRSRSVIPGDFALSVGMPDLPAPPEWRWTPLVDVARLESGHTPSRNHPEWWGGDVPWIGIRDARIHHGSTIMETEQSTNDAGLANSAARLLPAGTVCLSRTASVGYVVVMGRPMATSQDFVNWVCTRSVDPHWLKCLFLAEHDAIWRFGKGSTHTTVYFPEVLSFHVCLPPLEEQHEIVRRVEVALARIERVKAAVEAQRAQLDALDRAILDKAFRGELVPQDPNDEPAAVMLARLRAEREGSEATAPRRGRFAKRSQT